MVLISIFFLEGAYVENKHIKFQISYSLHLAKSQANQESQRSKNSQDTGLSPMVPAPPPKKKGILTHHPASKTATAEMQLSRLNCKQ